jgi:hypothetical protein
MNAFLLILLLGFVLVVLLAVLPLAAFWTVLSRFRGPAFFLAASVLLGLVLALFIR